MNGSGNFGTSDTGTSLSGALAGGNNLAQGVDTSNLSGLTQPLASQGMGNVGTDTYAFKLPPNLADAVASNKNTPATAGLTGVQSGLTMPNFASTMAGSGGYDSNNANWGGLAAAGGKIASQMTQPQRLQGGSGRVQMRAENFGAPVIALPMASGSAAGNSLLQMMQRYQPGNVVGANTGTGYGMR